MGRAEKNKSEIIAERQANLPLPDQPPQASDFNSADARTVNVGSGSTSGSGFSHGDDALREPATGGSAVREDPSATGQQVLGQGGRPSAAYNMQWRKARCLRQLLFHVAVHSDMSCKLQ